jgi:hypothetical protein
MGKRLVAFYDYIEERLGRDGKIQLAKLTRVPSVTALGTTDTPELLTAFREAIKQLTGAYPPSST